MWRIILGTVIVPICYPILIDIAFLNVHASICSSWWRIPVTQIKLTTEPSLVPTFPGRMAVCPIQLAINLINIKWNSWIQMITLFNFLNFFPQCITHVISFFTVECTLKKNGRCMCQLRQCIYISEIFLSYFLMGWLQFWLDIIFPCSLFLKSVRHFL